MEIPSLCDRPVPLGRWLGGLLLLAAGWQVFAILGCAQQSPPPPETVSQWMELDHSLPD